MDHPPPDPAKLLDAWMEWERGETPPGRVISNLKTGGMRQLLEELAASSSPAEDPEPPVQPGSEAAQSWTPVV
ncbi:MAG TPA: hypothetical protein VKU91_08935 [Acidimicrobiales bacterium]|nr:hypothetical protein [Acidimicrobiales bacterium]